jgi:hypothetical protein
VADFLPVGAPGVEVARCGLPGDAAVAALKDAAQRRGIEIQGCQGIGRDVTHPSLAAKVWTSCDVAPSSSLRRSSVPLAVDFRR